MNLIDLIRSDSREPAWGPTGKEVYERTYSRTKSDGTKEEWHETVRRVVEGNLSLVDSARIDPGERDELFNHIYSFSIIPAGRHLWMSGVEGRQFLFNCYVSGWGDYLSEHFTFTFNQLMEGGGVGSNYSTNYVNPKKYPVNNLVNVHIVCSDEHENYSDLYEAGILSTIYDADYLGAIEVEDSREGWVDALRRVFDSAAEFGGPNDEPCRNLVFDVSNVREAGKRIKTFGGTSAGPVPLGKMLLRVSEQLGNAMVEGGMTGRFAMNIDHEIANCVVSGNVRRSARMSIMHWNDPDIDWFLNCKQSGQGHWSTNISVEIDDEFIDFVNRPSNDGDPRCDRARRVYRAIVEGMLNNGEPGIWNSSLANLGEPNRVSSTNPCGEICLEEWENCNLGHVNLDAFVNADGSVDFEGLLRAHTLMTRFLIRATFGDISNPETREIVDRNRRIGVGHFGYAGYLAKRGIKFSESWKGVNDRNDNPVFIAAELTDMYDVVRETAISCAHELRIPVPVKLTTVAPTGTVAKLAGRTEGIHPPYAKYFIRRIRYSMIDPDQMEKIRQFEDKGYNVEYDKYTPNTMVVSFPTKESLLEELEGLGIPEETLESVDEINLEDMLRVQEMYQTYYADNAVSFTVNVPKGHYSVDEVAESLLPHLPYLKGTTMMVDESREQAPYERISRQEFLEYGITDVNDSYDEACASGACPVR